MFFSFGGALRKEPPKSILICWGSHCVKCYEKCSVFSLFLKCSLSENLHPYHKFLRKRGQGHFGISSPQPSNPAPGHHIQPSTLIFGLRTPVLISSPCPRPPPLDSHILIFSTSRRLPWELLKSDKTCL